MALRKESLEHLQRRVVYPATRSGIIEAFNKIVDVSKEDRDWIKKNLPDWSFRNAGEVIRMVQLVDHLERVTYPTTRKELLRASSKMRDVTKADREWFERSLPDRTYNSPDEIIGMLKGITCVREHVTYPATKSVIVETCNRMTEVPKENKEWFERYLPDRTYRSPEEVIKAFKI
jgi:hypothetical protein